VVNTTSQLFYTVPCKCDTGWTGELPLRGKGCDYNTGVVNTTSQLFYSVPCKCDTGWTGELPLEVKAVTTIQVWSIPHHSYSTLYHVNVTQDGQVSYL
jgi:hypothetical protein